MRQTLLRIAPDTFTMCLIATVVLASVAPPTAALETPVKIATDIAIAFMFFLYGARLATANVIAGVAHWRLHALVLAATFVMFPAIGLVLFHCLPQWLVPGPLACRRGVDGRDKPGHDDKRPRRPPKRATNSYRYKSQQFEFRESESAHFLDEKHEPILL
jgi:hypothetical protein